MHLVKQGLRHHGLAGSLVRAARIASRRLLRLPYLREQHLWWLLDLFAERPHPPLPEGLQCRRIETPLTQDVELITDVGFVESQRRLAAGAELWTVVADDGRVVSSCWFFRRQAPALASKVGWLELPADVVCMEDSFTIPLYRGRGIAAAGWSRMADALAATGVRAILGKVEISNTPSRRSLVKAGFKPIAYMELKRLCMLPRVIFEPFSDEWPTPWLVQQLVT
ncbi:MAG TPA: GNAT family N-acetyltransferase [Terriglobales bacterium]|nr:GNAT family N-acetyltransferase [Terriglobales bacterium]